MNFLKTAFWVIIAVALALFTKANWDAATPLVPGRVAIKLWGESVLEMRLPVLILTAFLLGLLPTWLWARTVKWQMRRKLASAERALASTMPAPSHADTAAPSSVEPGAA